MNTSYSLVCSLSEKEAIPAAVGFKARRSCCGLRQPVREKAVSRFFGGGGAWGFHCLLRAQTHGFALHGQVGSGGPAGSQGSPCPCPCQPTQGPGLVSRHSFADVAVSLGICRKANFKMSCQLNELFPSSSMTFYRFCSLLQPFIYFAAYCALVPIYLFFFFNKGRCKVIETYYLPLKLVPEIL